jgi:colanic acid biosynthesis glycosyl transferase WcaI
MTRRCEYLASVGHDVTVCTGMPHYPEWRVHPAYSSKLFLSEKRHGVKILRSWIWVPNKVTSAKRVLFESSFLASSLLQAVRGGKPDLLVAISPPLGLGLSAVLLSSFLKIPYIFDVQDLQPDAAADLGMLPRPVLPVLYCLEAMAYRNARLISTVTEGMRQRILAKGVPSSKVVVVPPPADKSLFDVGGVIEGREFRNRHDFGDKFIVAHSGNMGVKQGLEVVLNAATQLKDRQELLFLLAGDGAMKAKLENRAAQLKLMNVRFLPLQEQADFLQMLAAIDISLIVQQASVSDISFPSKTVTLLSAARPVGAAVSDSSAIAHVIRESKGGVVTPPDKASSLLDTIEMVFNDREKRRIMGECGRQYALRHWNEASVLPQFESHLLGVHTGSTGKFSGSPVALIP